MLTAVKVASAQATVILQAKLATVVKDTEGEELVPVAPLLASGATWLTPKSDIAPNVDSPTVPVASFTRLNVPTSGLRRYHISVLTLPAGSSCLIFVRLVPFHLIETTGKLAWFES